MKEKNKKTDMKLIKLLTIILAIILIAMVGFFGIYTQDRNKMSNKVKEYSYAMDIDGSRNIKLIVNTESSEVIKDAEGNEIATATDEEIEQNGYVKEQVPNNSEDILTEENYNNVKRIIEKRLKTLGVEDYIVSLNTKNGEINIQIPEDDRTDAVVSNLTTVGKFEIIDSETQEVLLDNSNIKSSDILYNTTSTGTTVYLQIEFNKEGKTKLEEISRTYVAVSEETTDTEEQEAQEETTSETDETATEDENTGKQITMKIDDEEIMTTGFEEPITTGKIQLSVGSATTDTSTLQDYISQAQNVSTVLDSGKLPIKYDLNKNEYILSSITQQDLNKIAITIAIISAIGLIILIVKYKTNGLLAVCAFIGLVALYLLVVRYTNVIMSIESIFGIVATLILDYIFTIILLNNIDKISKEKVENKINKVAMETYKKFFIRIIPICIMIIVFCFVKWIPISSFGMIAFWGLTTIAIYNAVITKKIFKLKTENK